MRDLIGYGPNPPAIEWPNQAKVAINFVINYEEGAELSPVNGDVEAETYGSDFPFSKKLPGERNYSIESFYEYGSRVGIWRLIRLFEQNKIPLTFFITGYALILNPPFAKYLETSSHEIAGHGWRWINYAKITKENERQDIIRCINTIEQLTGRRPKGWYTGRRSQHTRELLWDIGGFIYDSDSYADELPFKVNNQLVIPYSLSCNDFRFTTAPGFNTSQDFYLQLKNSFDYLYQENRLAIMTIGLHPRLSGQASHSQALSEFLSYLTSYKKIWIARRIDIANYWLSKGF
ncbi:chitin deacetylase [Legionella sp. km772]|nr:chitin deacetylase [Legionella sp. km772]